MDWLFQPFFDFLGQAMTNLSLDLFEIFIDLTQSFLGEFWQTKEIEVLLDFSRWASLIVFVISLLFMFFDIAEEGGNRQSVQWHMVMGNVGKALIFCLMAPVFTIWLFHLAQMIVEAIGWRPDTPFQTQGAILMVLLANMTLGIVTIAFFVMSLNRVAATLIMILSVSFYVSDIVRGDTTKLGSWLRQLISITFTFVFQYILYYWGLQLMYAQNPAWGLICWVGMFSVSKVLQQYGYSTGTKGAFHTVASAAGSGVQLLSKI